MAFERKHAAVADATFSSTGATNWNANQTPTGADVGGIPYCPTATTETTSANLTFSVTLSRGGPGIQIGSGSTSSRGWLIGYGGNSTQAGIYATGDTPSGLNYRFLVSGNNTYVNAIGGGAGGKAYVGTDNVGQLAVGGTAGAGITITAGTAATDVAILSGAGTVNAAGVTFVSYNYDVTYTASAADSLHSRWRGGAAGTTVLAHLTKAGTFDATAFSVGGAAGASFGPGLASSITVVNGIVTAIS